MVWVWGWLGGGVAARLPDCILRNVSSALLRGAGVSVLAGVAALAMAGDNLAVNGPNRPARSAGLSAFGATFAACAVVIASVRLGFALLSVFASGVFVRTKAARKAPILPATAALVWL